MAKVGVTIEVRSARLTCVKYVRFKQVVRNAYRPGSKQYRRIHLRAAPGAPIAESGQGAGTGTGGTGI
jgi:hypothetical protein